jgi:hypothetical protein
MYSDTLFLLYYCRMQDILINKYAFMLTSIQVLQELVYSFKKREKEKDLFILASKKK